MFWTIIVLEGKTFFFIFQDFVLQKACNIRIKQIGILNYNSILSIWTSVPTEEKQPHFRMLTSSCFTMGILCYNLQKMKIYFMFLLAMRKGLPHSQTGEQYKDMPHAENDQYMPIISAAPLMMPGDFSQSL